MVRGSPCDPAMGVRDDDPGFGPAPAGRKRVLSATRLTPPVKPAAGPVALRPRLSTGLPLSRAPARTGYIATAGPALEQFAKEPRPRRQNAEGSGRSRSLPYDHADRFSDLPLAQ